MRVGDIDFTTDMIERPKMIDGWASVHHNNERTLSANKVDEKLKECVDRKGLSYVRGMIFHQTGRLQSVYLIDISNRFNPESPFY